MKKLLLAFLFICCCFKQNFAQATFAPVGTEWYYRYINFWADVDSYAHASCVADTLINGKPCKKICLKRSPYGVPTSSECDETLFLHQSSDSIFLYNSELSFLPEWQLVFRNNFMVGDTFQTDLGVPFIVQSIDTVITEGQTIRWFNLIDASGYYHRTYSDVFGPYLGFFDAYMGMIADSHEYYLRCYQSPSTPLIHISTEPCEQVLHPQPSALSLTISPNPAIDVIHLNFKGLWANSDVQITFWDEIGRLVLSQDVTADNQDMDISSLPSGVYFVVSQSGSFSLRQKLVKV